MPARMHPDGKWRYRKVVTLSDGTRTRISGTPATNTKAAAETAEGRAVAERLRLAREEQRAKAMPTFADWFHGRFWTERLLSRLQSAGELENKRSIYRNHLGPFFGARRLADIHTSDIATFRAALIGRALSPKTINNILAVASTALKYAVEAEILERAPRIGLVPNEPPEVAFWEFDEYARIVAAAAQLDPDTLAAVTLAGETGMRVGEVTGLLWRDIDLIAGTITISQTLRRGVVGLPSLPT
jgi:integrase